MIPKKSGSCKVDKLRTIVLMEADFNHNNKFIGKSVMQHAIPLGLIAKEQYSVAGKKAIDHASQSTSIADTTNRDE